MHHKKKIFSLIFVFVVLVCVVLLFAQTIKKPEKGGEVGEVLAMSYVSGVVPHHLLASPIIESFFQELLKTKSIQEIVLLSPDHFNQASLYGNKPINDEALIKGDHGITNILPYLKKYFPDTKINPFLVPAKFSIEDSKVFTEKLNASLPMDSFVLASVDFSHYLPKSIADFHDKKSIRALLNFEKDSFSNIEVDCPKCLYIARYFAKLKGKENHFVIDYKNSQDFSVDKILQSTTSYFSVLFGEGGNFPLAGGDFDYQTLIFVGDMMFDRGIEYQMKKNNFLYPFEKIENVLKGVDYIVGNLEGPIVERPIDYGKTSLTFNFDKNIIDGLKFGHFNLLSLANNHTLDANAEGLGETKKNLKESGINYFGDPTSCDVKDIFSDKDFVFIGINQTYPFNCGKEKLIELVKNIRQVNLEKLLIVSIHWGREYQAKADNFQKNLAHSLIDAGADLIIGHHPHVVQEIEQYKGKFIAYSLGNFVFDQNFSKETTKGLMLKVIVKNKEISEVLLIEIEINSTFQPKIKEL